MGVGFQEGADQKPDTERKGNEPLCESVCCLSRHCSSPFGGLLLLADVFAVGEHGLFHKAKA